MSDDERQRQYEQRQADAKTRHGLALERARAALVTQQGGLDKAERVMVEIAATPATTDEVLRRILVELEAIHREIVAQRRGYTPGV